MLEILVFAFTLMYTPGPVNMLSLFVGINGQGRQAIGFCAGVGMAMGLMFGSAGYVGSALVSVTWQGIAALLGGCYIAYLGYKLMRSSFLQDTAKQEEIVLRFWTGFIMQVTNPKAMIVVLPVATIQFPAAHIQGWSIAGWSSILGFLAFGAPGSYVLLGHHLKQAVLKPKVMSWIKRIMACLLWAVAMQFIWQARTLLSGR